MTDIRTFPLNAQYTNVKSHGGKAMVTVIGSLMTLTPYQTRVATYNTETKELVINGTYSNTTLRHLKDFINQFTPFWFDK